MSDTLSVIFYLSAPYFASQNLLIPRFCRTKTDSKAIVWVITANAATASAAVVAVADVAATETVKD